MSEDVLVKWSLFITESASRSKYVFDECVGDLAAEVRFLRDNLTERELQVRHLVRTHEQTVDNLVAQMDSLQARVAELEKEHPVFVAAVAWATGREPFASATLEEAVDDYREETKL